MSDDTDKLIAEFIATYQREVDFYSQAARLCHSSLDVLLENRGTRAIITDRAKSPSKLSMKLRHRSKTKEYKTLGEIRDDIVDLAGVRIALYFPGDRASVRKLIEENFNVQKIKSFPDPSQKREGYTFPGYRADHFRVKLLPQNLTAEQRRFADALIEIQVASVLMHAWAEVEHDLVYKPEQGKLSDDETAILDELNGMVLTGELALEGLQRAIERRLSGVKVSFDNHFELAAFLHKWLRDRVPENQLAMGRVDSLFEILRDAELNSSHVIGPLLDRIDWSDEQETVADKIADVVLQDQPELYKKYFVVQTRSAGPMIYTSTISEFEGIRGNIGEFLSRWILLEMVSNFLKQSNPGKYSRLTGFRSMEEALDPYLSKGEVETLKHLRRVRNELVHGIEVPSREYLARSDDELNEILLTLKNHDDPSVREIYRQAEASFGNVRGGVGF